MPIKEAFIMSVSVHHIHAVLGQHSAHTAVSSSSGSSEGDDKIRKTAQDFEAMALGEMLQPMFETVDMSSGPFGGGSAEKQYQSLQILELGKQLAKSGGVGIAHQVYGKMQEMQQAHNGQRALAVRKDTP